jgi:hypothetical protein
LSSFKIDNLVDEKVSILTGKRAWKHHGTPTNSAYTTLERTPSGFARTHTRDASPTYPHTPTTPGRRTLKCGKFCNYDPGESCIDDTARCPFTPLQTCLASGCETEWRKTKPPRHFINYASFSAFISRACAKKSRAVPLPMFLMLYELPAHDWSEAVREGTPINSAVTRHNM